MYLRATVKRTRRGESVRYLQLAHNERNERGVPVASNNREIIYAQQGKAVALKKMGNGRWCIAGLSKTCRGLGHVTYVQFADDLASITGEDWTGKIIRPLTLGELGSLAAGGFGFLPLGAQGRFSPSGALIDILEQ